MGAQRGGGRRQPDRGGGSTTRLSICIVAACLAGFFPGCAPERGASDVPIGSRDAPGYVLFSPLLSATTYLIDKRGRAVRAWRSEVPPGASVYLLDNGHLLRCGRQPGVPVFNGGGEGGRIQEFTWDGDLVWDFVLASGDRLQHHDIEPLPNGNVLLIAWERKSAAEAVAAGRRPDRVGEAGLRPDMILEVRPQPPRGGTVVWEWHLWDHLIQEHDRRARNYGSVAEHPERVDINGGERAAPLTTALLERLRSLGYLAGPPATPDRFADFTHGNAIAHHAGLDQIALSVNTFNEIWIIDHGTTTDEAAGHGGGRAGRGGDLLYRWGNPGAYGRGTAAHRKFFGQHDVRWIPDDRTGAGHLLVFNNGSGRPRGDYSSVMEIAPPVDAAGRYTLAAGGRYGPEEPAWEYTAPDRASFFAEFISGAQRLPGGNTLICDGPRGRFFEVTPNGSTVWEYLNPYSGDAPNPHGDPPFSVFFATHIPPDHPGLRGREPMPLDPQPPRSRGNAVP